MMETYHIRLWRLTYVFCPGPGMRYVVVTFNRGLQRPSWAWVPICYLVINCSESLHSAYLTVTSLHGKVPTFREHVCKLEVVQHNGSEQRLQIWTSWWFSVQLFINGVTLFIHYVLLFLNHFYIENNKNASLIIIVGIHLNIII